jgi:hypothetical protein
MSAARVDAGQHRRRRVMNKPPPAAVFCVPETINNTNNDVMKRTGNRAYKSGIGAPCRTFTAKRVASPTMAGMVRVYSDFLIDMRGGTHESEAAFVCRGHRIRRDFASDRRDGHHSGGPWLIGRRELDHWRRRRRRRRDGDRK